jgi:hypothetical protein
VPFTFGLCVRARAQCIYTAVARRRLSADCTYTARPFRRDCLGVVGGSSSSRSPRAVSGSGPSSQILNTMGRQIRTRALMK